MDNSIIVAVLLISPVIGFLINGFRFRSQNAYVAGAIGTIAVAISAGCSILLYTKLLAMPTDARLIRVDYFSWLSFDTLKVSFGFVVDPLSIIMMLIITCVGTLIHLFSTSYMSHDERPAKYFSYLNLFIFNMLLLVMGENLLLMFFGWEGVGLCSYLLIGFWFKDPVKAAAGMKAFVTNRIGDAGFLLGIFTLFFAFGTVSFAELNSLAPLEPETGWSGVVTLACLFLFIGACGKSAQIPLYVWLPDAMSGPTPVSALIHAATMVTAGVYMIIRLNPMYLAAPNVMCVIACIGAATAFMAASIGLTQWDIKKVLAYSTVSQLGFMFLATGVGAFTAALFHLMTHAFFKALMFLGSGSVIHAMHEEQDMRKMGGLKKYMPITHLTFVCGWLAIIGFPFTSGFFSKDEILWMSYHSPRGSVILWVIAVMAAVGTAFYMTRLMCLTFWGKSRVPSSVHPHESPLLMTIPLMVLAILSIFAGWIGVPHVLGEYLPGHPSNILESWLHGIIKPIPGLTHADPTLELTLMFVSSLLGILSAVLAYYFYCIKPELPEKVSTTLPRLHNVIYNKYFVDEGFFKFLINPLVNVSQSLWKNVDVGGIDKITYLASDLFKNASSGLRQIQSGSVQSYAFYMLLGLVFITFSLVTR